MMSLILYQHIEQVKWFANASYIKLEVNSKKSFQPFNGFDDQSFDPSPDRSKSRRDESMLNAGKDSPGGGRGIVALGSFTLIEGGRSGGPLLAAGLIKPGGGINATELIG